MKTTFGLVIAIISLTGSMSYGTEKPVNYGVQLYRFITNTAPKPKYSCGGITADNVDGLDFKKRVKNKTADELDGTPYSFTDNAEYSEWVAKHDITKYNNIGLVGYTKHNGVCRFDQINEKLDCHDSSKTFSRSAQTNPLYNFHLNTLMIRHENFYIYGDWNSQAIQETFEIPCRRESIPEVRTHNQFLTGFPLVYRQKLILPSDISENSDQAGFEVFDSRVLTGGNKIRLNSGKLLSGEISDFDGVEARAFKSYIFPEKVQKFMCGMGLGFENGRVSLAFPKGIAIISVKKVEDKNIPNQVGVITVIRDFVNGKVLDQHGSAVQVLSSDLGNVIYGPTGQQKKVYFAPVPNVINPWDVQHSFMQIGRTVCVGL